MRRVFWAFLVGFVLLITPVSAQVLFDVSIEPQSLALRANETGVFALSMNHNSENTETFEIYSPDVLWDIRTGEPLVVPPGPGGLTTELFIRPLQLNPGLYGVPIKVRLAQSSLAIDKNVEIEITTEKQPELEYLPAIRGEASIMTNVDPREPIDITVRIENQNRLDLPRVLVKVRSALINKDYETFLLPLQRKTVTFSAELDPKTPPQTDAVQITLFAFDSKEQSFQFDIPPLSYDVAEYGTINESSEIRRQFLKTSTIITLSNTGNVEKYDLYKLKGSFFKNWFTSTEPKTDPVDNVYVWDIELAVGESKNIVVTTNYWPIFIVFLFILVLVIGYFVVRSPIIVKKSMMVVSQREGGISELKVIIRLTNRGRARVENVRVIDTVPRIAELQQDFPVGTLAPVKILRHDRKGTIIKWEIDGLAPSEEIILTYKMRSTLSILGGISLPVAVAKFVTAHGREPTTKSNIATI